MFEDAEQEKGLKRSVFGQDRGGGTSFPTLDALSGGAFRAFASAYSLPQMMETIMPICGLKDRHFWPNSCNLNLYEALIKT